MKCHKSCLPNRNPSLSWALLQPMWNGSQLRFPFISTVVQLSCKGKFSCNYILGQTLRRHKPAQPVPPVPQRFPGRLKDTLLWARSHTAAAARRCLRPQLGSSHPITLTDTSTSGSNRGICGVRDPRNIGPQKQHSLPRECCVTRFKILPVAPVRETQCERSSLFWQVSDFNHRIGQFCHLQEKEVENFLLLHSNGLRPLSENCCTTVKPYS